VLQDLPEHVNLGIAGFSRLQILGVNAKLIQREKWKFRLIPARVRLISNDMRDVSPYFIQRDASPMSSGELADKRRVPGLSGVWPSNWWRIFRQRWRLIAVTTVGALIICSLYLILAASVYTASSTILIDPVIGASKGMQGGSPGPAGYFWLQALQRDDALQTQCNILRSQSLAARVIQDLRLTNSDLLVASTLNRAAAMLSRAAGSIMSAFHSRRPSAAHSEIDERVSATGSNAGKISNFDPALVMAYLDRLNVRRNNGTNLITVSFSTPDPVLSARIVNEHVNAFISLEIDLHDEANRNAERYIARKVVALKDSLDKSEAVLDQFRRQHGAAIESPGQQVIQRIRILNDELAQEGTAIMALRAAHELIVAGDYELLPQVLSNPLVRSLKQKTAQLATQYTSMSNRFNPGYRPLDDLGARLDESRGRLKKEVARITGGIEAQYQAALAAENKLQGEIEAIATQAQSENYASPQDANLSREVANCRRLYNNALQRMNDLRMMSDVSDSAIAVVDNARPPQRMTSPSISQSVRLALVLGLIAGFGTTLILESLDDAFRSPAEVQHFLRLPTLGVVPDFRKLKDNRHAKRNHVARSIHFPVLSPSVGSSPDAELLVVKLAVVTEAYRAMRTALLYSRAGKPPKTIGITSSIPSEGKTLSTINLSVCFAELGRRILLIDADLRRPRCHQMLGLENTSGLSEILVGRLDPQQAIRRTTISGVYLISAGSPAPNPTELLDSSLLRDLLASFREQFDHILIDTPPIIPVSDGVIIATMVDGVMMITATNTPRRAIGEAYSRLQYVGAKVLGVVLNKMDISGPDYRYHNGYSYRYSSARSQAANYRDSSLS
jgi:succinoglycan biosynthesis transport protein ExoP